MAAGTSTTADTARARFPLPGRPAAAKGKGKKAAPKKAKGGKGK